MDTSKILIMGDDDQLKRMEGLTLEQFQGLTIKTAINEVKQLKGMGFSIDIETLEHFDNLAENLMNDLADLPMTMGALIS